MIPTERRQIILDMVAEKGIVSIAELTERMHVSHMTIRSDLQKLEQQGAVIQVSGGVQSSTRVAHEPSHQIKTELATPQKAAIGKLAASLVQPESCIYLDAGTTTLAIARQLVTMNKLTVVTNDFVIADYLMDNSNCTIIHTGGAVCRENRSCVGEAAATLLRGLMIDQAFISASSWSVRGISTPAEDKVTVKRAVASASRLRHHLAYQLRKLFAFFSAQSPQKLIVNAIPQWYRGGEQRLALNGEIDKTPTFIQRIVFSFYQPTIFHPA